MKLLKFILLAFILSGCLNPNDKKEVQVEVKQLEDTRYNILILDGCEYIVFSWLPRENHVITHKGNCKFCLERNQTNGKR